MDHEMSIQKRDKIADVMRGAERMGCTSHPTFRAAFPQIEAIHVEVEYTRIGHVSAWPSGTVVYSSLDNLSRFLDCRNPDLLRRRRRPERRYHVDGFRPQDGIP